MTQKYPRVVEARDADRPIVPPPCSDYAAKWAGTDTPLVIDHGSWECRVGWAAENSPRLRFENVATKYRDRKTRQSTVLVGADCSLDPSGRANVRSAWDANVVVNSEILEQVLDWSFLKLGVSGEGRVPHSVLMTEPVANVAHSRRLVSELLFEAYDVPSAAFAVDALCSRYANAEALGSDSGLVCSFGHHAVHFLPVFDARLHAEHIKRTNLGGRHQTDFMLRLLQLKYPAFPVKMTSGQAEHLVATECHVADDYRAALRAPPSAAETVIVQFPYTVPVGPSAEQVAAREARREEQIQRLRAAAAAQRVERLAARETALHELLALKTAVAAVEGDDVEVEQAQQLRAQGFSSAAELDTAVKRADTAVRKLQAQVNGTELEAVLEQTAPEFDLVGIPDDELGDEQRVAKRKQVLLKGAWDARERARVEKSHAEQRQREEREAMERERAADPAAWLAKMRAERRTLQQRQLERVRQKEALSDRRSQAAQARMKSLAQLAADDNLTTTAGNRRRRRNADADDGFGRDDSDWAVYRDLQGADAAEQDDELADELSQVETLLLEFDPDFDPDDTVLDNGVPIKSTIVYALAHGATPPPDAANPHAVAHQLQLNVERVRVPETFFQPAIAGLDQSGLVETVREIARRFAPEQQRALLGNVFLTGAASQFPGFSERLVADLRPWFPEGFPLAVRRARDPALDAWRGAALFARDPALFSAAAVTRAQWDEYGHDYLVEFALSNRFFKY